MVRVNAALAFAGVPTTALRTAYDALVESDEQTCPSVPTQWEGKLRDGRTFYFRYRWGHASLRASATDSPFDALPVSVKLGDDFDGTMNDETYRKVFVALLALIDATMPPTDDKNDDERSL